MKYVAPVLADVTAARGSFRTCLKSAKDKVIPIPNIIIPSPIGINIPLNQVKASG